MPLYVVIDAITKTILSPPMCLWSAEQWEDDWHDQHGWQTDLTVRPV